MTKRSIAQISNAIGHSDEEKQYFENLVFFNQAKTVEEKAKYYSKIVDCRRHLDIKTVDKDQYDFYSKWYHCIIRELATMLDFKGDFALLGSYVTPPVSAKKAQESVELLKRLGFIEQDLNGLFHQTDALIKVKPEAQDAFIIEKFQTEMLQMAIKSYDGFPRRDRMNASTTFSISEATFDLFKMKTREFRKELLEIAKLDQEPNRVFQFTFNLFPMCRGINEAQK